MSDCLEDWNITIIKKYWWEKPKKYPPHDCKPRGGEKGTPYRRFCKICHKAFKRSST